MEKNVFESLREERKKLEVPSTKDRAEKLAKVRSSLNEATTARKAAPVKSSTSTKPTASAKPVRKPAFEGYRTTNSKSLSEYMKTGKKYVKECKSCYTTAFSEISERTRCKCGGIFESLGTLSLMGSNRLKEDWEDDEMGADALDSDGEFGDDVTMDDTVTDEEQVLEVLDLLEVPEEVVDSFNSGDYEEVSSFLHDNYGISLDVVEDEVGEDDMGGDDLDGDVGGEEDVSYEDV